jgi:DNA polymerase V
LLPENALQTDMLGRISSREHDRASARMQALDHINHRYGKGKMYYAAEDLGKSWQPKHHIRSPRYVSNWDEIPVARIYTKNHE